MEDLGPPDLKTRRIEGELLGWDVSYIFDGHAIPAYGNHTTRLDRSRDRKLTHEAPPDEGSHTFHVEQAQASPSRTGLSGTTTT